MLEIVTIIRETTFLDNISCNTRRIVPSDIYKGQGIRWRQSLWHK